MLFHKRPNPFKVLAGFLLGFYTLVPFLHAGPSKTAYTEALSLFQGHLEGKYREIQEKSGGFRIPGLPFVLTHGHRTKVCVVLFHGLSDSPYFMRDIAESLYRQGYNVVAPLLSGNSTDLLDLRTVSVADWQKDADMALAVASGLGEKVVMGGLSAGSAISLDASRRHPGAIGGLLLFSPALSFQRRSAFMACWFPKSFVAGKPREVPVRYSKISNNSVCQLYHLVKDLALSPGKADYPLPIFAVLTEYDDAIKVQWTIDWIEGQGTDHRILAYVLPEGKSTLKFQNPARAVLVPTEEIRHAQVTRKTNEYNDERNIRYDEMEKALKDFMAHDFKP